MALTRRRGARLWDERKGHAHHAVVVGVLGLALLLVLPAGSWISSPASGGGLTPPAGGPVSSSLSLSMLRSAPLAPVDLQAAHPWTVPVRVGPAPSAPLLVDLSFPPANETRLLSFLTSLVTPSSPAYHHYLTQTEFDAEFGGPTAAYTAAEAYVQSFGATIVQTMSDRLLLPIEGSPAVLGKIFHTSFAEYRAGPRTYVAPTSVPELPAPLAGSISGVIGLSTYGSLSLAPLVSKTAVLPRSAVPLSAPTSGPAPGFLPPPTRNGTQYEYAPDYQVAYNEYNLLRQYGYPTNVTIGVVLWAGTNASGQPVAPYNPSDVYAYYNETLPPYELRPVFRPLPLLGAPRPGPSAQWDNTSAAIEMTLDLEMAGSTAPGAQIVPVYAPRRFQTVAGSFYAISVLLNPNSSQPYLRHLAVVTNSFVTTDVNYTAYYYAAQEAQARGISILAASGDDGSSNASPKRVPNNLDLVGAPASAAWNTFGTVAVGGSVDTLSNDTTSPLYLHLVNQTVWFQNTSAGPYGSSGGVSHVFPEPIWQKQSLANGVIQSTGESGRGVPDISGLANNTPITITHFGYFYKATNASVPGGKIVPEAGTSIASPLLAGVFATIDSVLTRLGQGWIGFPDPVLYRLGTAQYAAPPFVRAGPSLRGYNTLGYGPSQLPNLVFLDVKYGANALYPALPGYDLVTGWGAVDAYNLTEYLGLSSPLGNWGTLGGIRANVTLAGLNATTSALSPGSTIRFNASVELTGVLASALGTPLYDVKNLVRFYAEGTSWFANESGWAVYPSPLTYLGSDLLSTYNFTGETIPVTFPFAVSLSTTLVPANGTTPAGLVFRFDNQSVTLPVPGASYFIGSGNWTYWWGGSQVPAPTSLAPEFTLTAGTVGGTAFFGPPTAGRVSLAVQPSGSTQYLPANVSVISATSPAQESAVNLSWTALPGGNATFGYAAGGSDQGVQFTEPTGVYPLRIQLFQHPAYLRWTADVVSVKPNLVETTTGSDIVFLLPNGTYLLSFSNAGEEGTVVAGPLGKYLQATIDGVGVSYIVTFVGPTAAVAFDESGLPANLTWGIRFTTSLPSLNYTQTLNKTLRTTGGPATLQFPLFIPTMPAFLPILYTYRISDIPGWHQTGVPYEGRLAVPLNSSLITVSLMYHPVTYAITFRESGLPTGTIWLAAIGGGGPAASGTSSTLVLAEGNGSYGFVVGSSGGYAAEPGAGSITVQGANVTVLIAFSAPPSPTASSGFLGLPGNSGYVVLGGAMVVVAVAAVALLRRRPRTPRAGTGDGVSPMNR